MTRKEQYYAKLRDPRWQKMRLKIMERDEFTCQMCFDSESTLNVHHCYYKNGAEPWDYEECSLITLCEDCHANETQCAYAEKKALIDAIASKGLMSWGFAELAAAVRKGPGTFYTHPPNIQALAEMLEDEKLTDKIIEISYARHRVARSAKDGS